MPKGRITLRAKSLDLAEPSPQIGQYRVVHLASKGLHRSSPIKWAVQGYGLNLVSVGPRPKVPAITIKVVDNIVIFLLQHFTVKHSSHLCSISLGEIESASMNRNSPM